MIFEMGIFDKIFPTKNKVLTETEEKAIVDHGSEKQRIEIAFQESTSQEILYYMAESDPSPKVRKAVAQNPSTPIQAAPILAKDRSDDVRFYLAKRLVKVLPALEDEQYSQLYAFAVQALGELALDEILKIRKALSETLKDYAHTPPQIALTLAKDLEREVSEPILRFCTALSDDALIEVLQTHPAHWAANAVAQRNKLSSRVARAVIETGNPTAGKYLIKNKGAEISDDLLEVIVDRAREFPEWHRPIAVRIPLPPLMARKLAAYVDKSVRKVLMERSDLDDETIDDVAKIIARRIEYEDNFKKEAKKVDPVTRAKNLYEKGELGEQLISDAAAMRDRKFVMASMAFLLKTNLPTVEKVFDVKAPKAICALCWKAGLSMRFALQVQQTLANIPPSQLIYPRGGLDYPLSKEDMQWQLDVIGID